MANNKRIKNREIERARKQQRRLFSIVASVVALIIVAAIAWGIWDTQSRRWIMRFDGDRISTSDFLYLTGGSSDPAVKDQALESLVQILTILDRAEQNNVGINDEELAEFAMVAEWMHNGLVPFITPERAGEFLAATEPQLGLLLLNRLRDIYAPADDVEVDEAAFAAYIEEERDNFVNVMYVLIEESEDAAAALAQVGTVPFEDIIAEFDQIFGGDVHITSVPQLVNDYDLTQEQREALLALPTGEVSGLMTVPDGWLEGYYILVYLESRTSDEEIRDIFIDIQRWDLMGEIVEGWVREANDNKVTINQRAFNRA